ncbi:MAG: penicillin acylase family protein [Gammaproteobacteria bacterium]|nr:MAG: penicillin acylase family protein [Gammaproteobacteria bacterium]
MMKYFFAGCALLSVLVLNACQTAEPLPVKHGNPEILWDTWGVPHIVAAHDSDAFYAFGWAQMRGHADLLLKLYAMARGRGAEYFGEDYLATDRSVRLLGIPALAEQWYQQQEPGFKDNLAAFAAGINDFARRHPEAISAQVKTVLPVTPQDIIAHTTRVMAIFVAGISECGAVLPGFDFNDQPPGSNGWALGAKFSSSGNAMLLANPHLSWHGMETLFEAHILLPDVNLYGAALVGSPVLQIAFNDHLGWTHTVNPMDGCDLYQLRLTGNHLSNGYWLDDVAHDFIVSSETIRIRRADGRVDSEVLTVHRAAQGPVIEHAGEILSIRLALLETPLLAGMNQQWWEMGRATHLEKFQEILSGGHLPLFNVIYADADKHVMLAFNGIIPQRPAGDTVFWRKPVAGDDSRLIWKQVHHYQDLPKTINPDSGWVQNSNGAPWYMTLPMLEKNQYPGNMTADVTNNRELQGLRMLASRQEMSFEELIAAKHSTHSLAADQLLDDLSSIALASSDPLVHQAAAIWHRWDRQFLAESRGARLFSLWFEKWVEATIAKATRANPDYVFTPNQLLGNLFYSQPFDSSRPLITPYGLADKPLALNALREAITQLLAETGKLDITWGEVARLRRDGSDFPGNGADTDLGVFREIVYEPDVDGKLKSSYGDSFIAVIEFSKPVHAQVLMTYGNATQPPFFETYNPLELTAKQQLRPAWRSRNEIEDNVKLREILTHAPDHMNLDNLQLVNIRTIAVQSCGGVWAILHPYPAIQRAVI